jgi:chemotaxis protein methyltransferase CheR
MQPREFLDSVAALLQRRTGLMFSEARRPELERGVRKTMQATRARGGEAYLARLEADPQTLDDLVAEITIGETYFFREPEQFAVLREHILPDLLARGSDDRPLRVWSAGCATGEEPYSIAMVVSELGLNRTTHILGTDISRAALVRARGARYTRWSFRGVPETVVQTHFAPRGSELVLNPGIRSAVEFGYLNLAEDTYPSLATGVWGMDLILCRNVLIYFDPGTVARAANRLLDSLAEGGWLLLGASDPLLSDLAPSEVVVTRAGLAYRRPPRPGSQSPVVDPPSRLVFPEPASASGPVAPPVPQASPAFTQPPALVVAADAAGEAAECYARHDYLGAAEIATIALARERQDPALWVLLVRALANHGDLSAAGRASAAGLDRHRTSAELTYLHAVLLAEGGRPAESASAARAALYLDRQMAVAHLALGAALAKLGDAPGARRSFRNAAQLLAAMPPDRVVPASDGEPAGRLAEMTRLQLQLMGKGEPQ